MNIRMEEVRKARRDARSEHSNRSGPRRGSGPRRPRMSDTYPDRRAAREAERLTRELDKTD